MTKHYFPGQDKTGGQETGDSGSGNVQISLPKTDRPEGPFEHSGETAGWTQAEEKEIKEQEQQGQAGGQQDR